MSGLGLLASAYGDSDEEEKAPASDPAPTTMVINTAKEVSDVAPTGHLGGLHCAIQQDPTSRKQDVLYQNPQYDEMWAPQQGPSLNADEQRAAGIKAKSHFVGHVGTYHPASHFAFEEQYHTFNAYGFAADPSTVGAHQSEGAGPSVAARQGAAPAAVLRARARRSGDDRAHRRRQALRRRRRRAALPEL